ncbi:MAG TPA: M67 family metallopeptidase [Dehalococcoidia bacterium]|nr:M67 family metallopeptidase [Dehalococcoidia bacterium]
MALRLPKAMVEEMIAHAREDLPNEACGVILGRNGVAMELHRARNAEASPYRYVIHPEDLIRFHRIVEEKDWQFLVIYHSHVASEAYPSPTDVRMSIWPNTDPPLDAYPDAHYVLVSLADRENPVVRAFRITGGVVSEEPLETV